jgi:hypothetical protein
LFQGSGEAWPEITVGILRGDMIPVRGGGQGKDSIVLTDDLSAVFET